MRSSSGMGPRSGTPHPNGDLPDGLAVGARSGTERSLVTSHVPEPGRGRDLAGRVLPRADRRWSAGGQPLRGGSPGLRSDEPRTRPRLIGGLRLTDARGDERWLGDHKWLSSATNVHEYALPFPHVWYEQSQGDSGFEGR